MVSGTDFSFTFDVLEQSTDGPSFFLLRVRGWWKVMKITHWYGETTWAWKSWQIIIVDSLSSKAPGLPTPASPDTPSEDVNFYDQPEEKREVNPPSLDSGSTEQFSHQESDGRLKNLYQGQGQGQAFASNQSSSADMKNNLLSLGKSRWKFMMNSHLRGICRGIHKNIIRTKITKICLSNWHF